MLLPPPAASDFAHCTDLLSAWLRDFKELNKEEEEAIFQDIIQSKCSRDTTVDEMYRY